MPIDGLFVIRTFKLIDNILEIQCVNNHRITKYNIGITLRNSMDTYLQWIKTSNF